jgi:hypothetical protein
MKYTRNIKLHEFISPKYLQTTSNGREKNKKE